MGDGAGLYLSVKSAEARSWVFRYVRDGTMREMGLGSASGRTAISLVDARKKARILYDLHREGRDPLAERNAARAALHADAAKAITFKECAEAYISAHRAGWRNDKHAAQWENTLKTHAAPIMSLPVRSIDTALVLKVLEPIWTAKPETAGRVRGRIELSIGRRRGTIAPAKIQHGGKAISRSSSCPRGPR